MNEQDDEVAHPGNGNNTSQATVFRPNWQFAIDTLVRRISTRRQCPTCLRIYNILSQAPKTRDICDEDGAALIIRHDDTEEVVHQRIRAYEITGPVITHYREARYHRVDGDRSPEEVLREIARLLAPSPRGSRRSRCKTALDGRSGSAYTTKSPPS